MENSVFTQNNIMAIKRNQHKFGLQIKVKFKLAKNETTFDRSSYRPQRSSYTEDTMF
jgi:hypothetical protein